MILQVRLQKLPRAFVQLRFGAGTLLRSEGPPLAIGRHIALDRGDAHAESASGLDFRHPPLNGLDDLLAQVFRVSIHPSMMPYSPISLQAALGPSWGQDKRSHQAS